MTSCSTVTSFHHDNASGYYAASEEQCAIYARQVSNVQLHGDAYTWWAQADGRYARGHVPEKGAVLVLKRTSHMTSGHVAVVKNIVDSREINVTHSNWGNGFRTRHIIYESMRVKDVSVNNDWSEVRFWNDDKNVFGFPYAAYGFIYP